MDSRNIYLEIFNTAFKKYVQQAERRGYPNGMFTWFRHAKYKDQTLQDLEANLQKANDANIDPCAIIEDHFKAHKFNNHSFNNYLLDELLKHSHERWQKWNPKPIVFYRGDLYVFSTVEAKTVFQNGLLEKQPSPYLDEYCNGSAGIIAYKTQEAAEEHSAENAGSHLFKVEYRGYDGIDIDKTQEKRGNKQHQKTIAVSIVGKIKPDDICYQIVPYRDLLWNCDTYTARRANDGKPSSNLFDTERDCGEVEESPVFKMLSKR